jgi:CheY-like chemotaxis protein
LLQRQQGHDGHGAEPMLKAIETAQKASRSAAQLVQRLLAFGRQQRLEPASLDANALISDMADMISRTLAETVEVETALAPELWMTFADRNQLESALLNLVVNARDAMPDGGGLMIETANVEIGDTPAKDIALGQYVMVSVSDTGCGIAKELLDKVFEPFFTTKDVGMGSGLGLSMVYGFVRQSRGHVRIYSESGAGTTVKIYLPRLLPGETAERIRTRDANSSSGEAVAKAIPGETLLIVEDNDDVRQWGRSALLSLGYYVLEAEDAPSALRVLDNADGGRIDLLFTDLVLPGGVSGSSLAEQIAARRPGLPVLFTSGYTRNAISQQGRLAPDVRILAKPYTLESLASHVRQAIDAARPNASPTR